jgi:polar amino acid transport system substrate-binding protein
LQAGRVDAYVEVPVVFWSQVDRMGISRDSFAVAGNLGKADPIYVAFSPAKPESKELAKTLSDGIRALRKSGDLAKILAKYGVADWTH